MFRTMSTTLAGVAVVVCAFVVAPQAFATTNVRGAAVRDGRSPDTVGAAAAQTLDAAIATAMASHRTSVAAADMRSTGTRDATGRVAAPTATPQHSVVNGDSVWRPVPEEGAARAKPRPPSSFSSTSMRRKLLRGRPEVLFLVRDPVPLAVRSRRVHR